MDTLFLLLFNPNKDTSSEYKDKIELSLGIF